MPDHYDEMTPTGLRLEAQALRTSAARALEKAARLEEKAENGRVIRVSFGGTREYCYLIPEGRWLPNVGDEVAVPPSDWHRKRGPGSQLVTVVGYGRNGYEGPLQTARGYVEAF